MSGLEKALTVVAILLAVLLAAVVVNNSLFVEPELPGGSPHTQKEETKPPIDYGDGVQPKAGGERKSENFYTVLVLGRDTGGGGNTDTMLLASYDVTNQKAAVMSIPRDTMVNVSWDVKKINSVYNANGGGDKGIDALYKEIAQLVGFEPDYKVIVEWEAIGKLVDAIGGVWFDVPYNMFYYDDYQDLEISQRAGYRLLSGEDAMQVIRWRKNSPNSPWGEVPEVGDSGRMKIQQDFLKAVIQQMMTPANMLNIGKIAKVFEESVETDLSFQNILWFGKQAFSGGLAVEDVSFFTMPWTDAKAYSRYYSNLLGRPHYLLYVVPAADKLLEIVNSQLSPFRETFTLADLDIMYVNADGSIGSTTGYVEDSIAALPPDIPEETPPEPETPEYIVDEFGNVVDPETGEIVTPPSTEEPENGETTDPSTGEEPPPEETPPSGADLPETLLPPEPAEPDINITEPHPAA